MDRKVRLICLTRSLLHAREWLAGATVNYMTATILDRLKTGHINSDSDISKLAKMIDDGKIEFLIIPICNPDGYEYTWTTNRLWRKNRSYFGKGVDLNRNFEAKWGFSGSSSNPYSDVYSGPHAASESETIALESLFKQNADKIAIAFDFHSFSQFVLWPWSYDTSTHPKEKMHENAANILSIPGVKYNAMKSAIMYASSGAASDYYAQGEILSLTVELPPKSMNEGGFVIPPSAIESVGFDWITKISVWAVSSFKDSE